MLISLQVVHNSLTSDKLRVCAKRELYDWNYT